MKARRSISRKCASGIGVLAVSRRADVASQAGLVLATAGLSEDLPASRHRLVTAHDETRRLERKPTPARPASACKHRTDPCASP